MARVLVETFIDRQVISRPEAQRQFLLRPDGETLGIKLHATFINTKHRRDGTRGEDATSSGGRGGKGGGKGGKGGKGGGRFQERIPVDASGMLREHAETDLGTAEAPWLHLSAMQGMDVATSYYPCVHKVKLGS